MNAKYPVISAIFIACLLDASKQNHSYIDMAMNFQIMFCFMHFASTWLLACESHTWRNDHSLYYKLVLKVCLRLRCLSRQLSDQVPRATSYNIRKYAP